MTSNIHRENLVLYNVLNNEVIFENYFCNLCQFDKFRNLFIDFINSRNNQSNCVFDKNKIRYKDFNTEVPLKNEDYGRADLFLEYNQKEYIFEIKNKRNTHLTDNQPEGYLEYLGNSNKQLYFLIPRLYNHQKDISERWEKYNSFYNSKYQIYYWEDFIKKLKEERVYNHNPEINLFYEFCLYWFNMRPIIFEDKEKEMLNNATIPIVIQKLFQIVDGVLNENIQYQKQEDKQNQDCYGYIIDNKKYIINNKYYIWFGVDYEIWNKRNLPLTIQIYTEDTQVDNDILNLPIYNIEKFEYKNGEITNFIPFGQNLIEENNEYIVEQFSKEIENIIEIVKQCKN